MKKGLFIAGISFLVSVSASPSYGSAGYLPVSMGEKLQIEVCLPATARSPIYLQVSPENGKTRTVAVIKFSKLKKESNCEGLYQSGQYLLKYTWKVNAVGSLNFYDPKSKRSYLGWPDGVQ